MEKNRSGSWPRIVYESLYHIGSCIKILYYDLELDVDKEEKQLEDAHSIPAVRLLLFQLIENMDSMDQSLFVEKLKMHYPSLKDAKVIYFMRGFEYETRVPTNMYKFFEDVRNCASGLDGWCRGGQRMWNCL